MKSTIGTARFIVAFAVITWASFPAARAQDQEPGPSELQRFSELESKVSTLQRRVGELESRIGQHRETVAGLFICGAFCALWAQNTGRNPWLWFFLGGFFSVITLLVLLNKNADDIRRYRRRQQ